MRHCLLGLALVVTGGHAQGAWFTVSGDPANATVDTVQVDPVPIGTTGDARTMHVRVSRSMERRNWDGDAYRSYESRVVFDCRGRRAEYVQASFYSEPLWRGVPFVHRDYSADPKPMLFRDAQPNPTARIIRAACRTATG